MISPRKIIFRMPAPLIMIVITFLSSRSSAGGIALFPGADKIMHFAAFAVLAFALGLWFSADSWLKLPLRNFFICVAIASVFGILDEIHQFFVPGRHSDIWDWAADTLGAAFGSAAFLFGCKKHKGRKLSFFQNFRFWKSLN